MDTLTLIVLILLVLISILFLSISLISKWQYFRLFFIINAIITIGYFLYLIYGNLPFIGHDEYGIQRLFYILFVPVTHILINLVVVLIIRWKLKN